MSTIIWAKKSQGRVHHVADIVLTNRIISPRARLQVPTCISENLSMVNNEGHWWQSSPVIGASVLTMPNLATGKLEINNNGMVDKVYEFLESDGFKRIYRGKAAIKVMLKSKLIWPRSTTKRSVFTWRLWICNGSSCHLFPTTKLMQSTGSWMISPTFPRQEWFVLPMPQHILSVSKPRVTKELSKKLLN